MTHELKCWPEYFAAIDAGIKTFELRAESDRTFAAHDVLVLREWDPASRSYTGRQVEREVTFTLRGWGLQAGYVCLSIRPTTTTTPQERRS